jgi:hypothetical protein
MAKPFRWKKSDNIKRALGKRRVDGLLLAFRDVPAPGGPWPDRDPDAMDDWWRSVLGDSRAQRSLAVSLPNDHPDAPYLRLDRLARKAELITFQCLDCKQRGTFQIADIIAQRGADTNANAVGEGVLDCPDKYARRNGRFCQFRFELGGYGQDVQHVKRA